MHWCRYPLKAGVLILIKSGMTNTILSKHSCCCTPPRPACCLACRSLCLPVSELAMATSNLLHICSFLKQEMYDALYRPNVQKRKYKLSGMMLGASVPRSSLKWLTQMQCCRVEYAPERPEWQQEKHRFYVELPGPLLYPTCFHHCIRNKPCSTTLHRLPACSIILCS